MGFDIHQGSANGPVVFSEAHNTITNANGIFNLQIGAITDLSNINWEANSYFLQTAMYYDGLPAVVDLGTTQLLSVPYALQTLKAIQATSSLKSDTAVVAKKWVDDEPIVQTGTSGAGSLPDVSTGNLLIWYPKNAAFRAGKNTGNKWNRATMGINSFATGEGTLASGDQSASFGTNTEATGINSFAIGYGSKASGTNSFATGSNANASGIISAAIGENAAASASGAIAVGLNSKATDFRSVAIGNAAESSGQDAVALGYNSKATNTNSLAFGNGSEATGINAVSFGNSIASGLRSVAMGEGALAKAIDGVTIGTYNNSGDFPGAQQAATDRLFQIGNGTSASRSNVITVLRNGNVGFGNNCVNPEYVLDIGGRARIKNNGGSNTAGIYFNNSQNITEGFVGMKSDDEVGFYINNLWRFIVHSGGNVYAQHYSNFSDRALKTDIHPLQNSLSGLRNMQGYSYHWKDTKSAQTLQTGVIAQEVEKVFPELVSLAGNGFKAVNYIGLIPHLIEAVKELDKKTEEITALKKELASLQEMNRKLNALEASLKSLMQGQHETSTQTGK
ncbi:hypothetical protein GCM10010967_41360 [Dyadobacter beijingensis]|uniref:Peptidase S74 domain-containing protein n=1 Tax=Dyadobacter beijingensis TaxID=365489 RepID=A0ABQ2I713_9BACT|nr:hypothetical protein GCM10010967_41360 [Dyadobacter beijingensis]